MISKTPYSRLFTYSQPSSAIFDMFDDLLFLKKGGEVVFHGELGAGSSNLVSYFEDLGATRMSRGEVSSSLYVW